MSNFQIQCLGMVMESETGNPLADEDVLNTASTRSPDGQLYLFPRQVVEGPPAMASYIARFFPAPTPMKRSSTGVLNQTP